MTRLLARKPPVVFHWQVCHGLSSSSEPTCPQGRAARLPPARRRRPLRLRKHSVESDDLPESCMAAASQSLDPHVYNPPTPRPSTQAPSHQRHSASPPARPPARRLHQPDEYWSARMHKWNQGQVQP